MAARKSLGTTELDLRVVDAAIAEFGRAPEAVLPILQRIQQHYRWLPEAALRRVCERTDIDLPTIAGVSTFYASFRHEPVGRHLISVCHGTACHVKGAEEIHDALRVALKLPATKDTDEDGLFTVEKVSCLGCCTLAPVLKIDETTYGHLTPDTASRPLRDFLQHKNRRRAPLRQRPQPQLGGAKGEIRIGVGSCCVAGGASAVQEELEHAVRQSGAMIAVKSVGCVGMCYQIPYVEVTAPDGQISSYAKVQAADAAKIVQRHFPPTGLLPRLNSLWTAGIEPWVSEAHEAPLHRYEIDVRDPQVCAFLGRQERIATEWSGDLDPLNLDEYVRHDGFVALRNCLDAGRPDDSIDAILRSGLRGRGGAGYPTGLKWRAVRQAVGATKYIVCNGDEGDPGAFMDRMLLESFPFRIIEGMLIAAHAVGASQGILFVRTEYPLALERLRGAISVLERAGWLGQGIGGTDFAFGLRIVEGAGAYVSGEETALLEAIEGRRSIPRTRPPYPSECGLWGMPTNINNVETLAMVPWILRRGPEAFAALGTATSKGTKVFSLAGKVLRGGLVEVPMGITIDEIILGIGGGVAEGRTFKAVQIGGPSGGCIPASLGSTRVDFEDLKSVGCIMGSGGMVVLDDSDCMVDIARYFMAFTEVESCGKCSPCRVGTKRMREILDRICAGKGRLGDIERLEALCDTTRDGSLCGLGQAAPNPVLSTLRHFRAEYEAHIRGECPAHVCKALISYSIDDKCIGCTRCAQVCPSGAIQVMPFQKHVIEYDKCTKCDGCRRVCPTDAVQLGDAPVPSRLLQGKR